MRTRLTLVFLATSLVTATGCGPKPASTTSPPPSETSQPTGNPASSAAKRGMPNIARLADAPKLTKESLKAIETKYACKLPIDYREFLLSNNGGFPSPDCVTFEENGRKTSADVFCFFAIGESRASLSFEWHQKTFSDRLPKSTLPIGRDSCGNLWLVSLRSADAGSIFFWDHGSYDTFDETDLNNWPKVAASFREFLGKLTAYDAKSDAGAVVSRYSLAKQAADGMAQQDSGFSARANPDFVWHCDCDDSGNVQMQFVKYEVHAAATHTCGYARLLASQGLIKAGRPRLPK